MYNFNLNSYSSTLSDLFHDLIRSFENHKWSENGPEVISEGLNSKFCGGHAPRPPLRLHCRTQSLCPPPQNVLFCPRPSHPFENLCSIVHTPCLVHTNWHLQAHFLSFLPFLLLPFSHLLLPSFSLYLLPLTYLLSPPSPYLIPPLLSSSPPPISPSLTLPPPPSLTPPSLPHSSPECPSI